MKDIVERLRDANIGWSGDASCIDAEVAAEGAAEIERLREAVRAFAVHATYPVSTEINPRGYEWRGQEALDYAKSLADSILAAGQSSPEPIK